ncbi:acyl-CoA dehydrogenase family protein [Bradyrhizobium sp. JR3.5]
MRNDGEEEGRAFQAAAAGLELARAHTAARSIGLAQAALDHAMAYAKERVQFGEPIANFQAIRFKIATMATEIEAARQLMYHTCCEIDADRPAGMLTSMVKFFASEMAERVTSEALQILGGAGYTTLHPVERYWRDARLTKIFEGTSEIQQRIISDKLLGQASQNEMTIERCRHRTPRGEPRFGCVRPPRCRSRFRLAGIIRGDLLPHLNSQGGCKTPVMSNGSSRGSKSASRQKGCYGAKRTILPRIHND